MLNESQSESVPCVTVAMVTYNSEQYVGDAIESVLRQRVKDIELVIVDDASVDGTWGLVQAYSDPRIRAFRNEKNIGEYANRNRALAMSRGEYLIYIDGDDLLYEHGLEVMVRMLDRFPAAGAAFARPWSEQYVYPALLTPREIYLHEYLGHGVLAVNFVHILFRRSALQAVGGFDLTFRMGDTDVQRRIALRHPCVLVPDGCAWWRRRPGQASAQLLVDGTGPIEGLQRAAHLMRCSDWPLTDAETRQAQCNLYGGFLRMTAYMVLRGRVGLAVSLLVRARVPLAAWRWLPIRSWRGYTGGPKVSGSTKPSRTEKVHAR